MEFKSNEQRMNEYKKLVQALYGIQPKNNLEEIKNDVIHEDIYDITSSNNVIKGIAISKVGHKLAILPEKKQEAERCFKQAICILKKEEKNSRTIKIIEDTYINLITLYIGEKKFDDARGSLEEYYSFIKELENGISDEISHDKKHIFRKWINGFLLESKLLFHSGEKSEAIEVYKGILEMSGISLTNQEYKLGLQIGCLENGSYIKLRDDGMKIKPISGDIRSR